MQPGLSPMTVAWSMNAAACMMLGLANVILWLRGSRQADYLLAAVMALAAGGVAMTELSLAHALDVATYETLLGRQILLVFVILVSLVWFVYLRLGTASRLLAQVITLLWVVHLAAQFIEPNGAIFSEITSLERIRTPWGESFTMVNGPASPWRRQAEATSVLILVYLVLASVRAWRAGDRQRAVVIGGGSVVFIVAGGIHSPLVDAGFVRTPYMVSFAFFAVVMALTYQLVDEALRAGRYAREMVLQDERWQELLGGLPLFVTRRDATGHIQDANAALLDATGYRREELVGKHFAQLVPASEVDRATARFERAMKDDAEAPGVVQLLNKNGSTRSVAWSTIPLKGAEARIVGTLSVGLDLTEQERAEVEVERSRREMDRLSRTALLGEFSAGLAHELSQPLAAILSNAQAARRHLSQPSPDMEEFRNIVDDIIADDKRAGDVIHSLRAMLRRDTPESESADLVEAIHAASRLLANELRSHSVALVLRLDQQARAVRGDGVQIQQVVMNLILNAVRAMEGVTPARRELTIGSRASDDSVVVSVADRGSGIAAEALQTIFDPFVTTRRGGLGMGLAICRRIIAGSGGRIWAENRDGGGATMHFSLPLVTTRKTVSA